MIMNNRMAARWLKLQEKIVLTTLDPNLIQLSSSELINLNNALILKPLMSDSITIDQFEDITRYEATVNKIHIKDYLVNNKCADYVLLQGIKYALNLQNTLSKTGKHIRIILSSDPESDEVIVRFFVKRFDEPYGSDDPNNYTLEDIIYWDINYYNSK